MRDLNNMDIVCHAIAGAAVGYAFNEPLWGAIGGIFPDIVLGIRRRALPTGLYNFTHSVIGVWVMGCAGCWLGDSPAFLLALISHVLLDLFTHGPTWAPPLAWPYLGRYSFGQEWEYFNNSWCTGAGLTILWSIIWFVFPIGYR